MRSDGVTGSLLDPPQRLLEPLVLERIDLAAAVADDVMVMMPALLCRLVPRRAVAELDLLDETVGTQLIERAVHAREPDGAAGRTETIEDLLGCEAAHLSGEQLDDREAGPTAVAGRKRSSLPPGRHAPMVAGIGTILIIMYGVGRWRGWRYRSHR